MKTKSDDRLVSRYRRGMGTGNCGMPRIPLHLNADHGIQMKSHNLNAYVATRKSGVRKVKTE